MPQLTQSLKKKNNPHPEMFDFQNKSCFVTPTLLCFSSGSVSPGDLFAVC